jgi:hypothetical protein
MTSPRESRCRTGGRGRRELADLDHPPHRCHILETGNDSFRFKASEKNTRRERNKP